MPNDTNAMRPALMAASLDELLDTVVTAAALVARADGRVQEVERAQLLDFLDRGDALSLYTRAEVLRAFEQRARELDRPGAAVVALRRLGQHAGQSLADIMIEAAEEVAVADCLLDPSEGQMLRLMRRALGEPASREARAAGDSV